MSKKRNPVPRLDLAPKLKRPLSLWNPFDYLLLLYWVFFFPQALPWYVKKFKERVGQIKFQLWLQGLVLIFGMPIVLSLFLEQVDIAINWLWVRSAVVTGLVLHTIAVFESIEFSVAYSVTFSVVFGVVFGTRLHGVVEGVAFGVVAGVACGVKPAWQKDNQGAAFAFSGLLSIIFGARHGSLLGVAKGVPHGVLWGVAFGAIYCVVWIVAYFLLSLVTCVLIPLRPENWLFGLPFALRSPLKGGTALPRVTKLSIPNLSSELKSHLRRDWQVGVHNVNQLLWYTQQHTAVVEAVYQVLAETSPEQIVYRARSLAEKIDYRFFDYTRLNAPIRKAAVGFRYLYKKRPEKSAQAFAAVRHLRYGEEMFALAQTLATLNDAKELATIAVVELSPLPKAPLLRPTTWEAIKSFQQVIADTQIIVRSPSRTARSLALNRAQGGVKHILDNIKTIPRSERELIKEIAQTWQKALLELTAEVGQVTITKPVNNPYTIGDPVVGKKFVGREDIIRDLTELWILTDRPQSIVLYGHRRMGKTSILLNIANILGAKVKLAYINLLRVGSNPQGVGEVLIAITDVIAKEVNLEPPADADLLNLPYRNFERYLNRVIDNLDGSLIVALDEFEKIEELIANEKIPPDFMGFLRGMVQMNPKLAFALAGLHTLDEMTEDYFHPFFASIIPIRVGFLTHGATRQILANPGDEDFLLDYEPEALDRIYQLTHGQPYLVQLVGFLLVRRYNELTFETGRPQKNIFTIEDVEAVIDNPDFYSHGRYYFTGVWDQAARGAKGQQQILTALAPHQKQGLTLPALSDATGIDTPEMQTALETLERHDVVKPDGDNRWQIAVELLRRWVANR